jgi:hypothetical protein
VVISTVVRTRLQLALVLSAVLAYEAYALFVRRSGETAYLPAAAETLLSPEIAGPVTLQQTFGMQQDDLEAILVYARPSGDVPAGTTELVLLAEGYDQPVARQAVPASTVAAAGSFTWTLPRIAQSAGRVFTLRVTLPDAAAGHGLRFEVGPPRYAGGDLTIGDRSFWGDLKFETRTGRARLSRTLADLRRQAPSALRSGAVLVVAALAFNWALVTLVTAVLRAGRTAGDR